MSREQQIEDCLKRELAPSHLTIENESHRHSVAPGSETHFKVVIVSASFTGLGQVARQRKVNAALREVFSEGLHALSMKTATPEEWELSPEAPTSPPCLGGSKAS